MLLGVDIDMCDQEGTLYGVKRTCLLQESTLYGVSKDLFVTRMHVIWGQ